MAPLSDPDRIELLDRQIARLLPEAAGWSRGQETFPAPSAGTDIWIEPPPARDDQRLLLLLRRDGDMQVAWHVPNHSDFECFFVVAEEEYEQGISAALSLVADVLAERVVLVHDTSWFSMRGSFVPLEELDVRRQGRGIAWIRSGEVRTPGLGDM